MKIGIVLVVCLAFWMPLNLLYAQDSTNADNQGFLRFFYEPYPDTLLVNGQLVNVPEGEMYQVMPGKYKVSASKECHDKITTVVDVIPRGVKPVTLKFRHFSTFQRTIYTRRKAIDPLIYATSIALSSINETARKSILPVAVAGVAQQIFAWTRHSKRFDNCSWAYKRTNPKDAILTIEPGISSFYWRMHRERSFTYHRIGPRFNFLQTVNQKLTAAFYPETFYQYWDLKLALQKYVLPRLAIKGSVQYFPGLKFELDVEETFESGEPYREYRISENKQLLLFEYGAALVVGRFLDQELVVDAGGHFTNSFDVQNEVLVDAVTPVAANPDTIKTVFKLNNGINAGISLNSTINTALVMFFQYRLYSDTQAAFLNIDESKLLHNFRAGIRVLF